MRGAEFAFFCHDVADLEDPERRFTLSAEDIALVNPNTRTCPIFRSRRDAELTKAIYRRVPVLIKEGPPAENPWGVEFLRMFDMANDSGLFRTRAELEADGWRLEGNLFRKDGREYLPLYEAKMCGMYDHRVADVVKSATAAKRQNQPDQLTLAMKEDPKRLAMPISWVAKNEVEQRLAGQWDQGWLLGWRDITSTTNERTVIASILPRVGVGNKIPLIISTKPSPNHAYLIAVLCSIPLDHAARQKVGGTTLNFFIFKQLPVLPPAVFDQPCPWDKNPGVGTPGSPRTLVSWLRPRVLELTYTAWDLKPFAEDLGYAGPPFRWDEERRFLLRCELDAAFFHLYGINRDDAAYILDTFPIVRRKDEEKYGEYQTKRVILEIYDELAEAAGSGRPYQSHLDPPPADPRAAHAPREDTGQ